MDRSKKNPVVDALRREEANAVQLYLQYKGYHWNVAGPMFRDLHTMFDEHATRVLDTVDELAERLRILGFPAEYTLEELRRSATLLAEEQLPTNPKEMVERLVASHRLVMVDLKRSFQHATEQGDIGTADLFTRIVQVHEKMEWFLRELLESPGPLLKGPTVTPVVHHGTESTIPTGR